MGGEVFRAYLKEIISRNFIHQPRKIKKHITEDGHFLIKI
jgi:hypothetical protein